MTKYLKMLKKANKIAIFSHISPDPDTIGSSLALRRILISLGKDVDVFCTDNIPESYNFLDDAKAYNGEVKEDYDLLVSVDVSSSNRLGVYEDMFLSHKNSVKIDHHKTSEGFGKVNYVKICSCSAIIVYEISKKLRAKIDEITASLLFMGLCGDTGLFRNNNTDEEAFRVAADLLSSGADIKKIYSEFFDKRKVGNVKLTSHLLLNAKLNDKFGFAIMQVTKEDYKNFDVDTKNDNLANVPNTYLACGYKIAAILKEKEDGIHVSMRSKPEYDVSIIATSFGGGGHKNAAGCTITKTLDKATKDLTKAIENYLKENKNNA